MKQNVFGLSRQYVVALRQHLQPGARAFPAGGTAGRLGRAAVALGLETLDLARMHEQALVTLELSRYKNGSVKRAVVFFTAANTPIEETHRFAKFAWAGCWPRWSGARRNWLPATRNWNAGLTGAGA